MKKINLFTLFLDSLSSPKKLAAFRVLSIGKVIQYCFLLVAAMTLLAFNEFLKTNFNDLFGNGEIMQYAENLQWLIYPVALLFLFILQACLIFTKISIYAFLGQLMLHGMNRRGEYRQVWRTAAFAITWECVLSILFTLLHLQAIWLQLLFITVSLTILTISITKYPSLKKATQSA